MRRALVVLAVGAVLASATLFLSWGLLFYRPLPTIDGHYRMLGLHERGEVTRDVFGIPRIYARDLHDLFFLQGYITAQDRLLQMETMRVAAGEAFRDEAERGVTVATAELRAALDAYAAGVNKFIAQHAEARALPGELVLTGRRPAPWRPADTLAIVTRYVERMPPTSMCASVPSGGTLKGRPLVAIDLYSDAPLPGWYELGIDGGGLRSLGISLPGVPGMVAGHNGWIAWAALLGRGARPDPAVTLTALLDAPFARDAARLDASGAARVIRCASDRADVFRVDGPSPVALRDSLTRARGLDLEALRVLLGRPALAVGARMIVDLSDVDTSRSVVSHGASAHRSSPHFNDQAPLWEIGQTHRLPFTRGAIGRTDGELVLRAR